MKRILFVDDEVELLDSLRARLHKRRKEWEMVFVSSGAEVFEKLETQSFDLIVSDVRMPGIDGVELLRVLQEHWPHTIRIVLSGYAEQSQVLRLVSLAHQYVAKPCDAARLENMIERCLYLHGMLTSDEVRAAAGRLTALPPAPKVYQQLQATLANPNTSTAVLAELIAHDPAVATKVLQVVNSAFFRLARPVTRIKDAVTYLGFGSIRNLVMSAEVFAQWQHLPAVAGVSVETLQEHALMTASATAALCPDPAQRDDAWLVGLVHDIGYWVFLKDRPAEFARAIQCVADFPDLIAAERQIIGADHASVGAYLLGLWGLSYPLVEAVAFHHEPARVNSPQFDLLAMLSTAHALLPEPVELCGKLPCRATMTAAQFSAFNSPFDWQEANRRVQESCAASRS